MEFYRIVSDRIGAVAKVKTLRSAKRCALRYKKSDKGDGRIRVYRVDSEGETLVWSIV